MAHAAVALDREAFSCAICMDLLKNPVTLSCGHSYCISCVHSHWDKEEEKHEYSCPQCRQSFLLRPVLVKNTMLALLVEQLEKSPSVDVSSVGSTHVSCDVCSGSRLKAVKSCLQCLASFCEEHLEPHNQSAALRKHQLVAPSELSENLCYEHNEVKKMFCCSEQQLICVVCCMDTHASHQTVSAVAERANRQTVLEGRQDQILQMIQDEETDLDKLQQEAFFLRCSADEAVRANEETFTRLIHVMKERQAEVEQQILTQQENEEARVQEHRHQLQSRISELKRTQAQLDAVSLIPDLNRFLQDYPKLSSAEVGIKIPTQSSGSFEHVTPALSMLSDMLQQILKQGLDNISLAPTQVQQLLPQPEESQPQTQPERPLPQTQPEESQPQTQPERPLPQTQPERPLPQTQPERPLPQTQPERPLPQTQPERPLPQTQPERPLPQTQPERPLYESTNRREFFKYAQKITLDLSTAHRKLSLSEENQKVTFEKEANNYPKNPNRFSYYYQILSKQRLGGRRYWEVKWDTSATEWSDSAVTIAVCYNDIKRKGNSEECRFGYNDNSWALRCTRDGYSFFFDNVETCVFGPISSRIAVYLDQNAGVLSFYSITSTMNFLHRVQVPFTKPLHAGLKFGSSDFGASAYFPVMK
ncbi:E3 ubiquitin/ISG15 ligase TRIM25-like [Eucyclogobius newberryi]|uniref:E3 ubiquitin/ISG15 ligase TRIM25-like n=1 Tax=Eucyclogobius newberryi TaxID=166745 RepID=UPI003B5C0CF8